MKTLYTMLFSSLFLTATAGKNVEGPMVLGNTQQVHSTLHNNTREIQISADLKYNTNTTFISNNTLSGTLQGFPESSYFISTSNNKISGFVIISKTDDLAYKYSTNEIGEVTVTKTSLHNIMCVSYGTDQLNKSTKQNSKTEVLGSANGPVPAYSSLPGSSNVLYLDFDGYDLPAGSAWNNGQALTTAASGYSDSQIYQAWSIVAEDYAPFDLNVTTDESTFLSADTMTRIRMVFTPTNSFHPNAGGVAYVGVFDYWEVKYKTGWVFVNNVGNSAQNAGEACSHEAGHTLGLQHHGTVSGTDTTEYYTGHGNWGPIMGAAYGKAISQFSQGEFTNAFCYQYNNSNQKVKIQQDDLAVIAGVISYKTDDHGNNTGAATDITYTLNGIVGDVDSTHNNGTIERNTDVDVFHFYTGGGGVDLSFIPSAGVKTNLDIEVKLYDANNQLLNTYNTAHNNLCINGVNINQNLSAGYYFVTIDGVGSGDATTGWSAYNSMGPYSIQGTITNPDINTNTIADITSKSISIYPNPLNGSDFLNFNSYVQLAKIFDASGKLVISEGNTNTLDLSNLAQGLYTLQINNNDTVQSVKIIK